MQLLDQFITEECTTYVRELLLAAVNGMKTGEGPLKKRFEFNRFEVTIDAEKDEAVLEDVLDATQAGQQTVRLESLLARLREKCG